MGRSGAEAAYEALIELYEDVDSDDAKSAILRALGETGAVDAVPFLTGIVDDEYELSLFRQSAALSLGRIAAPESQDTLEQLLTSDDSVLRAYAIQALGYYRNPEASQALTAALRDSFWRVRVAALEALAEQDDAEALPAVAYKARHDPETPVRQAAIETLGHLGGDEAAVVLREIAEDTATGVALRLAALNVLAETDLDGSVDFLLELADEEWDAEGSQILDTIGRIASGHESSALAPLLTRLFRHPNYIIRIYAMRGFGRNGLTEFGDDVIAVADDSPTGITRTTALATLEQLGIDYIPPDEREDADGDPENSESEPDSSDGQSDDWSVDE
jgi:HEAT repeat protein